MIYARFDDDGRYVDCLENDAALAASFGFEAVPEALVPFMPYLKSCDGEITIDRKAFFAHRTEEEQARAQSELAEQMAELSARLCELDHDINACEDGQKKPKTEGEYRAERASLRNALRALQGKPALETSD